jgi:Zn-dependent alcohol dehydrogenase
MSRVVRFYQIGSPEVLQLEELEIGAPSPGEMRIRFEAIGLNHTNEFRVWFLAEHLIKEPLVRASGRG